MTVAIFEDFERTYELLRECLIGYTIRNNMELNILSFRDINAETTFEKYANSISIALISLNTGRNLEIGRKMALINPFCIICFYSDKDWKLSSVLHTRLYDFVKWETDEIIQDDFDNIMDMLITASIQSKAVFSHHSRSQMFYLPVKDIVYFQSDLKYVKIILCTDYKFRLNESKSDAVLLYTKLSSIETELSEQGLLVQFLRIHQSFLVNMKYIVGVNRQKRTVQLTTGEELPVSESCYKNTLRVLQEYYL